jgi:superfamily II DNA or RNA helicase
MGLSATPEREHDEGMKHFVVPRLGDVVYAYDHDRGIGDAVISDFRICFVGVDFEVPERDEHDQLSRQLERSHRTLLAEFPFLENAHPFIAAVKTLAARDEEGAARSYLRIAGERRRLLNGASSRHAVVFWLAEQGAFSGNRTLLFHETIADCEHLAQGLIGAGVAAAAHHSELDRRVGAPRSTALPAASSPRLRRHGRLTKGSTFLTLRSPSSLPERASSAKRFNALGACFDERRISERLG